MRDGNKENDEKNVKKHFKYFKVYGILAYKHKFLTGHIYECRLHAARNKCRQLKPLLYPRLSWIHLLSNPLRDFG